jgi:hypothetical protein
MALMNFCLYCLVAPLTLLVCASGAYAQHPAMPAGVTHEQHMEQLKAQSKKAMGFDQDTSVHHFRLAPNGGSIAAEGKMLADEGTRAQIRSHLKEIAVAFQQGDFAKPFMTHGEQPPGVSVLQRLKAEMAYTYEDTDRGGVVRIASRNAEAVSALHDFLKYQITEHGTGDPLTVSRGGQP